MSRSFVIVDSVEHGELVDSLIAERIRDVEQAVCNRWSGVHTDGKRFGVLWGSPASSLFGHPPSPENPDGDPSLVIVEEDEDKPWAEVPPPEPEVSP